MAAFYANGVALDDIYQFVVTEQQTQGFRGIRLGRKLVDNAQEFRRLLVTYLSRINIEDMWLPYYCIGGDANQALLCIARGKLRHAVKQLVDPYLVYHNTVEHDATDKSKADIAVVKNSMVMGALLVVNSSKRPMAKSGYDGANPFNRWFHRKEALLDAQVTCIEDKNSRDDTNYVLVSVDLQMPQLLLNNQTVLQQLVDLGYQQSGQFIAAITENT